MAMPRKISRSRNCGRRRTHDRKRCANRMISYVVCCSRRQWDSTPALAGGAGSTTRLACATRVACRDCLPPGLFVLLAERFAAVRETVPTSPHPPISTSKYPCGDGRRSRGSRILMVYGSKYLYSLTLLVELLLRARITLIPKALRSTMIESRIASRRLPIPLYPRSRIRIPTRPRGVIIERYEDHTTKPHLYLGAAQWPIHRSFTRRKGQGFHSHCRQF